MERPKKTEQPTSSDIAIIAATNVDGYLRNASKRMRVPDQSGGRGTRRKLAMVTSTVVTQQMCKSDLSDDDWDEVILPVTPLIKKDPIKTDPQFSTDTPKTEIVSFPFKSEGTTSSEIAANTCVKSELLLIEDDLPATAEENDNSFAIPGSKAPLIERPQRMWRSDPGYEALVEQRDLLAAQRKSERMRYISEFVLDLLAVMIRGRLLWRESHHVRLLKVLLSLKFLKLSPASDCEHAEKLSDLEKTEVASSALSESFFPFLLATKAAAKIITESKAQDLCKPSLTPTWVTLSRDTANNKTSQAVKILLKVIHDYFDLLPKPPAEDANVRSDSGASSKGAVTDPKCMESVFSVWSAPISSGFLYKTLLQAHSKKASERSKRIALPHPLYFSVLFLLLAAASKMDCRLVIAKKAERASSKIEATAKPNDESNPPKLEKMSIFQKKAPTKSRTSHGERKPRSALSKKLPTSCFWVEVWSCERQCFLAVNPCAGCTTLWGAPYTFSVAGDVIVDVTPRYIFKYSSAYAYDQRIARCKQYSFLWKNKLSWDDNREVSEVLLDWFRKDMTPATRREVDRERKQLDSLAYSEPIPTTLNALHRHPLFVIEPDLARHEGVYPKNSSTMLGSVKGHVVYKRSAVVSLRSRDGWLREGRSLIAEDAPPYKVMPPPPSRPFGAQSVFYGIWQTKPFEPLPLDEHGSIPHHRQTSWYILLEKAPPKGIVHLKQPQIVRVARRMQLDFGLAVTGFIRKRVDERRRGHWEAIIEGIVVKEVDEVKLVRAYDEWLQLVQEQEAKKRRNRALSMWLGFCQRLLSMQRLRNQYLNGLSFGGMPSF